jgi:hypothetical protein
MMRALNYYLLFSYPCDKHFKKEILPHLLYRSDFTYCDVPPESRDIGARIHDCFRAKQFSPTTNQAIAQQ